MGGKGIPGDGDNMDKGPVVGRCFSGCSIEFVLIFVSMCVYVVCVCVSFLCEDNLPLPSSFTTAPLKY